MRNLRRRIRIAVGRRLHPEDYRYTTGRAYPAQNTGRHEAAYAAFLAGLRNSLR